MVVIRHNIGHPILHGLYSFRKKSAHFCLPQWRQLVAPISSFSTIIVCAMFNNNLVCDIVVLYISTNILLHASLNHLSYLILPRYFITCVIEVNKKKSKLPYHYRIIIFTPRIMMQFFRSNGRTYGIVHKRRRLKGGEGDKYPK